MTKVSVTDGVYAKRVQFFTPYVYYRLDSRVICYSADVCKTIKSCASSTGAPCSVCLRLLRYSLPFFLVAVEASSNNKHEQMPGEVLCWSFGIVLRPNTELGGV